MDWLFERMIELAAWVAFILGIVLLCDAVWMLVLWAKSFRDVADADLLAQSGQSAGAFVLSALALGALACIDRYVFDLPDAT